MTGGGMNPYIIQHLEEDGSVTTFELDEKYWLKGKNAPTYLENYEIATGRKEA